MKKVKIAVPEWLPEIAGESWELDGVEFSIDDTLRGIDRDLLNRRANSIALRGARLFREGGSLYEDEKGVELMVAHYAQCRKTVLGVTVGEKILTASEKDDYLDDLGLLSRDELCKEVVGANALGLKNG